MVVCVADANHDEKLCLDSYVKDRDFTLWRWKYESRKSTPEFHGHLFIATGLAPKLWFAVQQIRVRVYLTTGLDK